MPILSDANFSLEDYLYNKIVSAAVVGGKLATVVHVERVVPPEQGPFPCVGLAFSDDQRVPKGARIYEVTSRFDIVVAAKTEFSEAVPDTTESARLALRNLIDDGNGNGMSPLLKADPTLGGLCTLSWIASLTVRVVTGKSAGSGTLAAAIYSFHTQALTR